MPEEGVVNTTYLSEAKALIEGMSAKGIFTLVDMHQATKHAYTLCVCV